MYFVSDSCARKVQNLARDSHCAITVGTEDAHLVVEGEAAKVRDEAKLRRVADAYAARYQSQVTVRDGVFDVDYGAPTAGPPPFEVYEVTPRTVFGFDTNESFSPTRWRF